MARYEEKAAARLGQPDLASAADEERRPDLPLELGHPDRQRGLGHADMLGRLGEAAGVDDGEELADVRSLYHKFFLCLVAWDFNFQIGSALCRERVCQYV